ncbi:Hsp70 family protein [Marinactinospora endophytica]
MATYGIDLGTTYSCVASIDDTGRPTIAKNAMGNDTTPSVVYFESAENVVVGEEAKNTSILFPDLVVSLIKRQMGEDVAYDFHGYSHTPESISALILRELARAAGEQTREAVRDVVITVPAYFGLAEKDATRKAGEIAGLNVLDVVPEPVAAALHYQSLGSGAGVRHILVYDLGGGTFDTTVIRIEDNDVRVVCTDGDHRLGGSDWDEKLGDYLLERFVAEHPEPDPSGDEQFMQDLSGAAEQIKKSLSSRENARHNLRFEGSAVRIELSRAEFEELTSDLLERTLAITERTIEAARERGVDGFDDVLLVGGMTRMPAIARALKERFGFDAHSHEPDLAVAKGAALFALMRQVKISMDEGEGTQEKRAEQVGAALGIPPEQVKQIAEKKVTSVAPRAFGIKLVDSKDPLFATDVNAARRYINHLITANTPLPADVQDEFGTIEENQTRVLIEVWEQAGSVASEELEHNIHIGEGTLSGLPPGPAGTPFNVNFHMTETGLLKVHGWDPATGNEVRFEIQIGGLTQEKVEEARTALAMIKTSG